MEKRYLTASGSTVLVLLSVTLVRSDRGGPQYFIAHIQDITERKAQQAALQDLVEMLSHDLRTPISVVTGYADLLVEEWSTLADDEREGLVRQVSVAGHAVLALLEDTLTVSQWTPRASTATRCASTTWSARWWPTFQQRRPRRIWAT